MFVGHEVLFESSNGLLNDGSEKEGIVISCNANNIGSIISLYVMSLSDDDFGKVHLIKLSKVIFKNPNQIKDKVSGLESKAIEAMISSVMGIKPTPIIP